MKSIIFAALAAALVATGANAVLPSPPSSDKIASGSLTAQGACSTTGTGVYLDTRGLASVGMVVTGTFVGTLTFKGAIDEKITFNTLGFYPQAGGAAVTTATSTGSWLAPVSGYRWACVYFSAYTSGTATIRMEGSVAPLAGGVAGSGSNITQVGGATLALGSATSANSVPVVIASDQGVIKQQGTAATGAAVSGNPVYVGGNDGTNAEPLAVDTSGRVKVIGAAATGAAVTGNPLYMGGSDGTNVEPLAMDTSGRAKVIGAAATGAAVAGNPVYVGGKDTAGNAEPIKTDILGRIIAGNVDRTSYGAVTSEAVGTAAKALAAIEADGTNKLRLRYLKVCLDPSALQTTAGERTLVLYPTTAGSAGGSTVTPIPMDSGDSAFGGVARSAALTTTPAIGSVTVATAVWSGTIFLPAAATTAVPCVEKIWSTSEGIKPPTTGVATTSGLALGDLTGGSGGTGNYIITMQWSAEPN